MARGDPILLEIPGTVRRYTGAIMRTAVIGKPSELLERMSRVGREAHERMIERIEPGRTLEEVWQPWAEMLEANGFEGRFKRAGYSIGIAYPPGWAEGLLSFRRGESRRLRENMIFHIPSMVKDFGTAAVGTCSMVRVTATGHEIMSAFEAKLFVC